MAVVAKLIVCLVFIKCALGANILHVSPIASPSHHIWNKALAMGLIQKGHKITMLTHETEKSIIPDKFTVITMEGMYDILHDVFDMDAMADETILNRIFSLYDYGIFACEYDYNTTGFKKLFDYPEGYKFDLIIYDATIGRCLYPLIAKFNNPPVVAITPFLIPPVLANVFGKHIYTSYMPFFSTIYTNKMNLVERTINFFYTYVEIFYRDYIFLPRENAIIEKKFKDYDFSLDELERNIGLLLCNTDPILEYPEAFPPNIVPVGGLHARASSKLPKEWQKVVDEAKNGIILFSLGSNVRSDKLDHKVRQAFFDVFTKLPQTVIWKFETEDIENVPKNVIIRKWLPQNDLLGHPNTILFIGHGGALSTQEAIYHGVPTIGIPFFADQHVNVRKIVEKGIAKRLDRKNLTSENIHEAIKEVLTSPKYRDNMRKVSKLYHDQPQTALEKGIFWIEHVLRHGTAEHLVSVSRNMPTYQSTNLDVMAVFGLGVVSLYWCLSVVFNLCRSVIMSPDCGKKKKD